MKSDLDNLIEELEAGTWQVPETSESKHEVLLDAFTPLREGRLPAKASRDAERRFGEPHAKLFPFIGRKVRTPGGAGTLLQVFADRVTVVLDSELSRCSFFRPVEIEPIRLEP